MTLCDSADLADDHSQMRKVLEIEDDTTILLNYVTFSVSTVTVRFSVMYQERQSVWYTTVKSEELNQRQISRSH